VATCGSELGRKPVLAYVEPRPLFVDRAETQSYACNRWRTLKVKGGPERKRSRSQCRWSRIYSYDSGVLRHTFPAWTILEPNSHDSHFISNTRLCLSNSRPKLYFAFYQDTTVAAFMSTNNQTTDPSTSNFTAIFDAASQEYKSLTKQDLGTHPFAAALEGHDSPDAILAIFRKQAQAFDKFRNDDDKLMAWLAPIVNILFTFSATLGEGIGLVSFRSLHISAVL
jgi:hypothetical protein